MSESETHSKRQASNRESIVELRRDHRAELGGEGCLLLPLILPFTAYRRAAGGTNAGQPAS